MAKGTAPKGRAATGRTAPTRARPAARTRVLTSRRAVVLVALAILCTVTLAPHVRLYVDQERRKGELAAEIEQREQSVSGLEQELTLWRDDAYVAAQARERLQLVMPGETGFVVAPGSPVSPVPTAPPAGGLDLDQVVGIDSAWYRQLWQEFVVGPDPDAPVTAPTPDP